MRFLTTLSTLVACFLAMLICHARGEDGEPLTIKKIMSKAHQPGRPAGNALDQRVIAGKASDDDKRLLLQLYEVLAAARPPHGSEEDWNQRTGELVEAARGVVKNEEKAAQRLAAALNCKACHDAHRTPARQAVFPKSPPPEFVVVSQVNEGLQSVTVQSAKITPVTRYIAVEVVQEDGAKTTRQVPTADVKMEIVEVQLSLNHYRMIDIEGKDVTGDALWKRLAVGKIMLLQTGIERIDPAYFKALATDALIVVPATQKEKTQQEKTEKEK